MIAHGPDLDSGREELSAFFRGRGVDMDAHAAVFETIRTAAIMVTVMEERALRPSGLTHAGYRVLCELWVKGPLELRQLAAFMTVSRPSIGGTVNTLANAGLVSRERSHTDRRLVTVALTPAGLAIVKRADAAWHAQQLEVTRDLDPAERRAVATFLQRLALTLQRLKASETAG
jgi:DNA-binding MarR family transcriptional regulator